MCDYCVILFRYHELKGQYEDLSDKTTMEAVQLRFLMLLQMQLLGHLVNSDRQRGAFS